MSRQVGKAQGGEAGVYRGRSGSTYQAVPREHLQQGDEVVAISEVFIQVADVPLSLRVQGYRGYRWV